MVRYVVVNEYEPSSAQLRLGGKATGDPIYRGSSDQQRLQVGPAEAKTALALVGLVGLGGILIYFLGK